MVSPESEKKALLVVVPSRGRPDAIARLVAAWDRTVQAPESCDLLVGLDSDDPRLVDYVQVVRDARMPRPVINTIGLRQAGAITNWLLMPRLDAYHYVGFLNDDSLPRTRGWEQAVIGALEQGYAFCFTDDRYPRDRGSFACHIFTHAKVVQALGYLALPAVRHMGIDVAWDAWARATSVKFLDSVVIEHLHHTVGKRTEDQTDRDAEASHTADLEAFRAYRESAAFDNDVAKIRWVMGQARPSTPDVQRGSRSVEVSGGRQ